MTERIAIGIGELIHDVFCARPRDEDYTHSECGNERRCSRLDTLGTFLHAHRSGALLDRTLYLIDGRDA
jgi:hypothetical protein